MEVCDSLWALAAFAGWILLGFAVYFIIAQRLLIEKLEAAAERNWHERKAMIEEVRKLTAKLARFAPFDADQDGSPGGRKRHDPYIERAIALAKEPSTRP